MRMQQVQTMAAAGFLLATLAMTPAPAIAAAQKGWQTYRSPDYGFRIDYPRSMTFYPGGANKPPEKSMFPICDPETVACLEYNGHAFDRTQIQAMGLSVNVLRDIETSVDCNAIQTDSEPVQIRVINGIEFHYAEHGDAGLGSGRSIGIYRTLHQGVCFEVALVTAQSDLSGQDLKDAGRVPAKPRTLRKLDATMEKMLTSFAFTGSVSPNAGWSRFTDSPCGDTFEYPDSATVETEVPSSLPMFNALGLTCLHLFTYRDRQYAVAAKQNFPDWEAMNAWLESAGFPPFHEMKSATFGPSLTEFWNSQIAYFISGSSLFLVTVTDGSNNPVAFDHDRVVQHLLNSFCAN